MFGLMLARGQPGGGGAERGDGPGGDGLFFEGGGSVHFGFLS